MYAGQTSVDSNGVQNCLHPLDYMNITQGRWETYSHTNQNAIDYAGRTSRYPYYAPVDCTCVYVSTADAWSQWDSNQSVHCADGVVRRVSFAFLHDLDSTNGVHYVGKSVSQGGLIGHTGNSGQSAGDHMHMICYTGTYVGYYTNMTDAEDILYINDVEIVNDKGYAWLLTTDSTGGTNDPPAGYPTDALHTRALNVWRQLRTTGWSAQSIAGIMGNMQTESMGFQHDLMELGQEWNWPNCGYGLVQWTPATKLIDWCVANGHDYTTVEGQIARIKYEFENGVQWFANPSRPDLQFVLQSVFVTQSNVELCADEFLAFYEHPADPTQPLRLTQARYWFDWLHLVGGGGTTPEEPTSKMPALIHLLLSNQLFGAW